MGTTTNAFVSDDRGNTATGTAVTSSRRGFDGLVQIRIVGDSGTIRVPVQLMPPLRGKRDADGSFELRNVTVSDRSISGQFQFNFLNKPKFVVDRSSGAIEMTGFGNDFSGTCERLDDSPEARKF